jgi:hypothetical protein
VQSTIYIPERLAPVTTMQRRQFTNRHVMLDLHQTTLIVKFKPLAAASTHGMPSTQPRYRQQCPQLFRDANNQERSPWYAAFQHVELALVFKRFFYSYCELQILFRADEGRRLLEQYQSYNDSTSLFDKQDRLLPWQWVKVVTDMLFETPYQSIDELKDAVQRVQTGAYDAHLFAIRIRRAANNTWIAQQREQQQRQVQTPITTLVGDAVVTAHYRLGIGINNAFGALEHFALLIRELSEQREAQQRRGTASNASWLLQHTRQVHDAVARHEQRISARLFDVVQLQVSTMYYESVCDLLVFFDPEAPSVFQSQALYWKNRKIQDYSDEPLKLVWYLKYHCSDYQNYATLP